MDNIVSVLPEMINIEHAVSILVTLRRLLPKDDPVLVKQVIALRV